MREDLSVFFADFAEDVSGVSGTFSGIFDAEYVAVGEVPVDSYAPRLTARVSDLTRCGVEVGTTLGISGADYTVRSVQPDGTGMATLVLEAE